MDIKCEALIFILVNKITSEAFLSGHSFFVLGLNSMSSSCPSERVPWLKIRGKYFFVKNERNSDKCVFYKVL